MDLCSLIESLSRRLGAGLERERIALQVAELKLQLQAEYAGLNPGHDAAEALSLFWDALDRLEQFLEGGEHDLLAQAVALGFEGSDILRALQEERVLLAVA